MFSVNNSNKNSPTLLNKNNRLGVTFNGNDMKQNKSGYSHGKIVNLYIVYELKNRRIDNPDFIVENGLSGAVKIAKNANTSHYKYNGMEFVLIENLNLLLVILLKVKCNNLWC